MNREEACRILGVSITAGTAEIEKRYKHEALLRHPDKTVNLPEGDRLMAEEELKRINAAHDFLKDPKNRGHSTSPKLKVSPQHIRFKDIRPGDRKATTIKIESVGGPYTKFWMDDSPAGWLRVSEVKSTTNDPLPLEATIEATNNGGLPRQSACCLQIRLEDEKSKTKDEAVVKVELWTKTAVRSGVLEKIRVLLRGSRSAPTHAPPPPGSNPISNKSTGGRHPKHPSKTGSGWARTKVYLGSLVTDNDWHPIDFDHLRGWAQRAHARMDSGEVLRGSHFMYRMNHRLGTYELRLRSRFKSCKYNW